MSILNNTARTILGVLAIMAAGCKKQEVGYLSDNIYYLVNPFSVTQGVTTTSSPLVADGSTAPLHVKLLGIRDLATGKGADSAFLQPQPMYVYKDAVTYADSTVDGLLSKLKDSSVAPFSVNSIGGRLQFTSTTTHVPQGSYTMDIEVSNVRTTKTFNNICEIDVVPTAYFVQYGTAYGYLLDTVTQARVYTVPDISYTRDPSGDPLIIMKWVDEDGNILNPKNKEVHARTGLASFVNWDPYYDMVVTDTAFVFQYPPNIPNFPAFNPCFIAPSGTQADYWCYYETPGSILKEGQHMRTGFSFLFPNPGGTYEVTIREVGAHKK